MRTRKLVGGAVRYGTNRAWAGVRPGSATDLRARAERPVDLAARPPAPDEVFLPATVPTGPWTGIDPLHAGAWRSGLAALASVGMWAFIGWRVQRDYRADAPDGPVGGTGGERGAESTA